MSTAPEQKRPNKRRRGPSLGSRLRNYFVRHAQVMIAALGQLSRSPFSTLMTTAVLGIALAMPGGLHVLLKNARQLASGWDGATQISLFLTNDTDAERARGLADALRMMPGIRSVEYISREQALQEFKRLSGFGDALDALDSNPLPAVLVVHPRNSLGGPAQIKLLLEKLRTHPEVKIAQLDMQWVKRLYALMDIARRAVWVLATLLSLAVLLVVGNTIRLAIQNRREEIVITKLIGGTDGFIRRPFLYTGLWYGLFGGLIAVILIDTALLLLKGPVQGLADLYHSGFSLQSLDFSTALALLCAGTLLGLLGSWIAVGRHLRDIEPT